MSHVAILYIAIISLYMHASRKADILETRDNDTKRRKVRADGNKLGSGKEWRLYSQQFSRQVCLYTSVYIHKVVLYILICYAQKQLCGICAIHACMDCPARSSDRSQYTSRNKVWICCAFHGLSARLQPLPMTVAATSISGWL